MSSSRKAGAGLAVGVFVGLLMITLILGVLGCWTIVGATNVGVADTMGRVDENVFGPGFVLKNPLKNVIQMPVSVQSVAADDISALTGGGEGQRITVHVTIYYHMDGNSATKVYKELRTEYQRTYVDPQMRGAVYDVVGQFKAEQLYTNRDILADPVKQRLNAKMNHYGLYVDDVLIRGVFLDPKLEAAIQEKQAMEQAIQKKGYEVKVTELEAERKRVEAQGIADSNEIIAKKLTREYLEWAWIEQVAGKNNTIYVTDGTGVPSLVRDV
jgi:regulator of protease activity HflC (stomatin/prohibitin superfamily)